MRGRIPKPWLRASTGQWYVTIDGRQICLGKGKREAHAEFARLMAARGRGPQGTRRLTVSALADLWLGDARRTCRPRTLETYEYHARLWSDTFGGLLVTDLRPYHVQQWLDSFQWGQATRSLAVTVVKRLTSWGEEQGYLEADPLRRLKKPAMPRRKPTTLEDFEHLLLRLPPFASQALLFLRLTGLRPGELVSMTIEETDLGARTANVVGKRGPRQLVMSEAATLLAQAAIGGRRSGPVWLSHYGKRLTGQWLRQCVGRHRGADLAHVVPHGMRGLFSTEALRAGVDSLLVAKLLGHTSSIMLAKHYASPDEALLKDAAEKAGKSKG